MEGGLSKEESIAVASALHKLGVEEPSGLADAGEKYARHAADAAGLKPIRADKLVKIIASKSVSSPTGKAEVNQFGLSSSHISRCNLLAFSPKGRAAEEPSPQV